ncbi:MAG TPA: glycosyl hydrolase [Nocardioides sp.]|uniref:glycosyl hydrolase n=1 Tax=Nocardioides sp. TaxID=35761 RepID=UPI002C5043BD|nr:glycosyl hydrolase [Nocardioides sp.]HTW16683.1 glycosyl hydrolase [Nocardioides sp.]
MSTVPRPDRRLWGRRTRLQGAVAVLTMSLVGVTAGGLGSGTAASAVAPLASTALAGVSDPLGDAAAFAEPSQEFRPMMRWWWAAPLTAEQTVADLEHMKGAGFGGAEIAYDAGSWATPAQRDALAAAVEWARENDFQLDMTLGAAWPVSTPATDEASGLAELELQYGRADVTGGDTFSGPVPAAFDGVTDRSATLVAVTAARVTSRGPVVTTANEPPARSTVLDPTSLVDLTDDVEDGSLEWTAPDGDWIVFAFWSRASSGGKTGVANLFDAESARAATGYVGDHQLGDANKAALPGVGGAYFEDSLENHTASQYWTRDMLDQFEERRGYALTTYLPLVFMQGMSQYAFDFKHTGQPTTLPPADFTLPGGDGQRVLNDYWRTLDDLYADEHLQPFIDFADETDMRFRTQAAFGETLNTSRAARELARAGGLMDDESLNAGTWDPAQVLSANEGAWRFMADHYRSAVGGSHQGGQTQVSSELGAAIPAFMPTMRSYRQLMDTSWAMGISRPIVHGYAYQTPDAAWPGTSRFGDIVAESWNADTFPQWEDWEPLADYWARGTYVLQSGTPRSDVAVLYDGFLTSAATPSLGAGTPVPGLFDGLSVETRGYQLQYVDSAGLAEPEAGRNGVLYPDGPAYRALVIDQRSIDPAAAEAVAAQAEAGLAVVIVGDAPSRAATYGADPEAANARVTAAVRRILAAPSVRQVASDAGVGAALDRLGVRPSTSWSTGDQLYSQRRETTSSDLYYVYNPTTRPVSTDIAFEATGSPRELDLWTGSSTALAQYRKAGDRIVVPVTLAPGENTVLGFPKNTVDDRLHVTSAGGADVDFAGGAFTVTGTTAGTRTVTYSDGRTSRLTTPALPAPIRASTWDVSVEATGPEPDQPTHELTDVELADWRSIGQLKDVAGVATYTSRVELPAAWTAPDRGVRLDLGKVEGGSVKVYVNGRLATPEVTAISQVDITRLLTPGSNELRVEFRSTLRNKATALGIGTMLGATTQATGLLGPVRLIPDSRQRVAPANAPAPAKKATRVKKLAQSPARPTAGKRFVLRLWVSSPAGGQPTGRVRVLHRGKQVGTARVTHGTARVRVKLPQRTRPGKARLVLRYGGDARYEPSSTAIRVTVTKPRRR